MEDFVMRTAIVLFLLFISGCGPYVPVTNISDVPQDKLDAANEIQVFETGNSVNPFADEKTQPQIEQFLGRVTAYSCKHLLWEPAATKENALMQLKLKALDLNADGIVDITYNFKGTSYATDCWESVQVTGTAVKLKKS
jgi:uncharacterized protein YbjQ (UPF0145 family)